VGWQCKSADDVGKTVWMPERGTLEGTGVVVEGKGAVFEHRAKNGFPGFVELRLVGCRWRSEGDCGADWQQLGTSAGSRDNPCKQQSRRK
jgi:hypothetical protein